MAVIWVTIGVVVYWTFVAKPAPQPESVVVVPVGSSSVEPGATSPQVTSTFNLETLRAAKLINLKLYGEVPLEVKSVGRPDPFSLITNP